VTGATVQGKILIVDAIATNRIVLKVKLVTAYYEVMQATTMAEAVQMACTQAPDLIISALSLPDGDAATLRRLLRNEGAAKFIPVMAVGAQVTLEERVATLKAGVRDILSRPLDETMLLGRVRSLIRVHSETAEWQMRDDTSAALGLAEPSEQFTEQAHCMLVSNDKPVLQTYAAHMRPVLRMKLSLSSAGALTAALRGQKLPDVFVFILPEGTAEAMDALRMLSALRANASMRHIGIVVLQTACDSALAATALDMGADDLMANGFDATELSLRLSAVVRRTRMAEQMRSTVRSGLQAAVFDPLTGLHNRRYAMPHLARIASHAVNTGRGFAVLLGDLDHFKQVNDRFGHAAGDAVLSEVADRLRASVRNTDMVARIGGEEFLVVMPGTPQFQAQRAALRICQVISGTPFEVPDCTQPLSITISIGMSINESGLEDMTPDSMLQNADKALYAAKGRGRNQVTMARPAA
jgi:two-component system cell cycle response regulator